MRSCRAKLRSTKVTADQMILQALQLSQDTHLDTWKMDIAHAAKLSSRLIFHPFTNCSPFAVVAIMGYLSNMHQGVSIDDIAEKFSNKEISMINFLTTHLPGHKPKLTQVALYLQGLRYSQAANRQELPPFDPAAIKTQIQEEFVSMIRRQQEIRRNASKATSEKQMRRLMEAEKFTIYHTFPKLFTPDEVDGMNIDIRDPTERYRLMHNGLLMHHCCYPTCPQYLTRFMTEKDQINSRNPDPSKWTRYGIRGHFEADILNGNYVSNYHTTARHLAYRSGMTLELFRQEMTTILSQTDKKKFHHFKNLEADLENTWVAYQTLRH